MARGDNECMPFFEPGTRPTGHCSADVIGKRFIKVSQAIPGGMVGTENVQVAPCGAGQQAVGVAAYDEVSGGEVPILAGPGMVVPITAGAAITAGQLIMSDAAGKAIPFVQDVTPAVGAAAATKVPLGQAWDDAANNTDCPVRLFT